MFLQLFLTGNSFKFPSIQLISQMKSSCSMSFLKHQHYDTQTPHSLDLDPALLDLSSQTVKRLLQPYPILLTHVDLAVNSKAYIF